MMASLLMIGKILLIILIVIAVGFIVFLLSTAAVVVGADTAGSGKPSFLNIVMIIIGILGSTGILPLLAAGGTGYLLWRWWF